MERSRQCRTGHGKATVVHRTVMGKPLWLRETMARRKQLSRPLLRRVAGKRLWDRGVARDDKYQDVRPTDTAEGEEEHESQELEGRDELMEYPEEEESEEARPARPARDPGAPTKVEYERHMLMHMAYRSMCPWYVSGRGRSAHHRRTARDHERVVPVVAVVFFHHRVGHAGASP